MSRSDTSFLSRWSRRKLQVREGLAEPDEAAAPLPAPALAGTVAPAPVALPAAPAGPPPLDQATQPPAAVAPAPTLDDVAALSMQSDYSRFVAHGVAPEVKNAALKKLFADPHFNLMDGLDTYIDDYGKPDPLPAGMLRKMVQSQLLGLFDDEKEEDAGGALQAMPPASPPAPTAAQEAHPDLSSMAVSSPAEDGLQAPSADAADCGAEPGAGKTA